MKYFLFAFTAILSANHLQAQDKSNYKFGKITPADFNLAAAKFDSGANAVISLTLEVQVLKGITRVFYPCIYEVYACENYE
jgi:hypothetical protein